MSGAVGPREFRGFLLLVSLYLLEGILDSIARAKNGERVTAKKNHRINDLPLDLAAIATKKLRLSQKTSTLPQRKSAMVGAFRINKLHA